MTVNVSSRIVKIDIMPCGRGIVRDVIFTPSVRLLKGSDVPLTLQLISSAVPWLQLNKATCLTATVWFMGTVSNPA